MMTTESSDKPSVGRNEPCPCGSGKKYKRCHGVAAAPKLSAPKNPAPQMPMDPSALGGMNPELLMQFTQAMQKLPRGQIQRFQSLMQKAMGGQDITREAAEFEKTLPLEFQTLMQSMGAMGLGAMGGDGSPAEVAPMESALELPAPEPSLSAEEARKLVAKAAAEGKISQEQAAALLQPEGSGGDQPVIEISPENLSGDAASSAASESKFKSFFKKLGKK